VIFHITDADAADAVQMVRRNLRKLNSLLSDSAAYYLKQKPTFNGTIARACSSLQNYEPRTAAAKRHG